MTKRYQHMMPELTTSIADRVGGLFWAPGQPGGEAADDGTEQAS